MKQEISMTSHLTKTNYKAFVGIDWANDKHDLCVQDPSTGCLLYTSPSPRDEGESRMPSSA